MHKAPLIDLGEGVHLIDGFDLGMPGRTGTYVIQEKQLTLVETGPSPSIPYVLDGLKQLDLDPADIRYIIVTHIHLDHAGGAGLLLKECPNATVVVHPRGARHLADPSRLITGARAVYGSQFDQLFDPIIPIPEERLMVREDGEQLMIGPDCTLQFYDTPGHAAHHFSIYDTARNGIYTGDTAGIRYHQTTDVCGEFYLPSTSPNQFDPDAMLRSLETFRNLNADKIYFGHFGVSTDVEAVYGQVKDFLPRFVAEGEKAASDGGGIPAIASGLTEVVKAHLTKQGVPEDHDVYNVLQLDLQVCAMGIADYLQKRS